MFTSLATILAVAAIAAYLLKRVSSHRASRLANATILIIRHSEKPATGRVLNKEGQARAKAYAHYFAPFYFAGQAFTVDTLIAGADSKRSIRPRQTLMPLSQAIALPINAGFGTDYSTALAQFLHKSNNGQAILICWRHNQMADLLTALGADPSELLPSGKWPSDIYDWVLMLKYNSQGKLSAQQQIQQPDLLNAISAP